MESIIIWDDMLRNFMSSEMMPLKDLVVPMVWVYAEEVYHFMPTYNWDRFSEVFPTAWTASAYKGMYLYLTCSESYSWLLQWVKKIEP